MGMLDFLKRGTEDDLDDFDEELLDDDLDAGEKEPPRSRKEKKPLLRFSKEEEEEVAELPKQVKSRFSTDYRAYLLEQAARANDNLRRRTAEAYELVRQTADQPLVEGAVPPMAESAFADVLANAPVPEFDDDFEDAGYGDDGYGDVGYDEDDNDAYIPGADEFALPRDEYHESEDYDFDDDLDDDRPVFDEFDDLADFDEEDEI